MSDKHSANDYINFKEGIVFWDKLKNDINYICKNKYNDVKLIEFTSANMILSRKVTLYTEVSNVSDIYIGIDINGLSANFMFCKYPDFQHYAICYTVEEFLDVIYNDYKYSNCRE